MTGIVRKQERLLKRADITEDGIDYNDIKWEGMWVSPLVFFFTPSRPVRLYQGDEIEGEEQERERKKKHKEKEDKQSAEDACL